jgi:hypothetical protein
MLKQKLVVLLIAAISVAIFRPVSRAQEQIVPADAWQEMLKELNLSEGDLGFRPKGYWTRYPDPQDIPYKLLAFDDLMAEPQRIYDFVREMALSVEDYLHPQYLADSSNALLKVTYYCGVRNATAELTRKNRC